MASQMQEAPELDPLWRTLDSSKVVERDRLELVIQKKKLNEVYNWFKEHFVDSKQQDYINRCPIVIIQGPTGCGKTTTLKWIANSLKIPVKEYSEITDTTAINYDIAHSIRDDDRTNLSNSIDRRKALKFENFVTNSLRYNSLYQNIDEHSNGADSEFDTDDEEPIVVAKNSNVKLPQSGVIILIDTPLAFARSQRVLIQSLHRVLKLIREMSKFLLRRIAIVFETLEGDCETITLPAKIKLSLGIQVFKFNPVTRANMKKFVDHILKGCNNILIDKETIEQLVNDCDGDMRACINTLQLICSRNQNGVYRGIKDFSIGSHTKNELSLFHNPVSKRLKVHHDKVRQIKLNPSLMRDNTRSLGFFHVLGKIFYQKRLYPENLGSRHQKSNRYLERPYPPENSTEYIADMLSIESRNLMAWLHHHYHRFCDGSNIEKAALFMENLASTDTISLGSLQSTQFYEAHHISDQIQTYLAIESTVFSLYQDQSLLMKPGLKKIQTSDGARLVKSSVENLGSTASGDLYSFNKPTTMTLHKLVSDYQNLLDCCSTRLMEVCSIRTNLTNVIADYLPYLNKMASNWFAMRQKSRLEPCKDKTLHPIFSDRSLMEIMQTIEELSDQERADVEAMHEKLLELIERVEEESKSSGTI